MINWLKFKYLYFVLSAIVLLLGVFGIWKWGFVLGVDFSGGVLAEYRVEGDLPTEELKSKIEEKLGIGVFSILPLKGSNNYLFRFSNLPDEKKEELTFLVSSMSGKNVELVKYEEVGPSIGPELIKKTIYAILLGSLSILLLLSKQFKEFRFGLCAILAMLHDSFVLVGSFSWLGRFFGAEIDFLFVTALLTTLSFSVHDTIVVYDRIREISKKEPSDFETISNRALTETMVRSLNNSFTIVFMLVAMILLGGTSIKWFAIALLIGTVSGTYSSPFVAVPLLVVYQKLQERIKRH